MDKVVFKYILFVLYLIQRYSRGTNALETFQDEEIKIGSKTCTCSFTMVKNNGLVDVQTAKCNTKCSRKGKVKLGGPATIANLYNLEMRVSKGSVTV